MTLTNSGINRSAIDIEPTGILNIIIDKNVKVIVDRDKDGIIYFLNKSECEPVSTNSRTRIFSSIL